MRNDNLDSGSIRIEAGILLALFIFAIGRLLLDVI